MLRIAYFLKSSILVIKGFILKIKEAIIPSKLSDVQISGKKSQFTKDLGLVKYEQQEIPLPRVTEPRFRDEDRREDADAQTYYLFQFVNIEKNRQKKYIKELARKNVAEFISILHYLSYKKGITAKAGSFSPNLYRLNVTSIEYSSNTKTR